MLQKSKRELDLVSFGRELKPKLRKMTIQELTTEMELAEEVLLTPIPFEHIWLALASIVYMASKMQLQKRKGVQHV